MNTAKDEVRQLLDRVPDDASLEDIQYYICICQKLDRGLTAADQGRVLTQDEVERRMARWLEQQSSPEPRGTTWNRWQITSPRTRVTTPQPLSAKSETPREHSRRSPSAAALSLNSATRLCANSSSADTA